MACGVLTVSGTPQIYCVGGSAAGAATSTARVFSYNPATNAVTTLAAGDNWPGNAGGNNLPGGFAVFQNKLYILGGFTIGGAGLNSIYQFDPTLGVGSKRGLKSAVLPVAMAYVPATAIGTLIFTGGGSTVAAGALTDSTNSFVYNPVGDSISPIVSIPRATGETRAVNVGGKMWVLGGGRTAPNPSTEVDIYDPGAGSWSIGQPFATPRRNFPADSDGSRVFLVGGYDNTGIGVPINTMKIFGPGAVGPPPPPTASPSPTATATASPSATPASPTPTATATATPSATATPCSSDLIVDGGFETGGIPNTFWNPETSTNFGTPLCDVPSCGTGGGASPPRTGAFWLWFGGIAAPETATLGQTVTIPTGGSATLHFWMRVGTVTTPFTDVVNVRVDGAIQQTFTEPTVAEGAYTERVIDLTAFANGASHALLFEYIGPSSAVASFVIDDVSLIAGGGCATPSPTATVPPSPSPTATVPPSPSPTATVPPTPSPTASPSATPCGSSTTFANASAITINDAGVAAPYPSNITVSGITNPVI